MKNRWLIAASAVGIHLCIGSVYAWSVFNLPLENAFGWAKSDIAITFSLAIFFLGLSAAVMGHFESVMAQVLPVWSLQPFGVLAL